MPSARYGPEFTDGGMCGQSPVTGEKDLLILIEYFLRDCGMFLPDSSSQQDQWQPPEVAFANGFSELRFTEAVVRFDNRIEANHLGQNSFLGLKSDMLPIQFSLKNGVRLRHKTIGIRIVGRQSSLSRQINAMAKQLLRRARPLASPCRTLSRAAPGGPASAVLWSASGSWGSTNTRPPTRSGYNAAKSIA